MVHPCYMNGVSEKLTVCVGITMKIEIATESTDTTQVKGNLLENLAKDLLKSQSYKVEQQVRFTGTEIDLLCKHEYNDKEIYVECKAHENNIQSDVIKNLVGELQFRDCSEVWLISTSDFGKDAKGLVNEWQKKDKSEREKITFYRPVAVINALINANVICKKPDDKLSKTVDPNKLGEWFLCVSNYGRFWVGIGLEAGVPAFAYVYHAKDGKEVDEAGLIENLKKTNTSISNLEIRTTKKSERNVNIKDVSETSVVKVQFGESWSDYRPSRPKDFVGRQKEQGLIFDFFKKIREKETDTRVFAITGNSGMGKSSLIAKLVNKLNNKHNKKSYFGYAVDVRAASSPGYIYSALLTALKAAQSKGFGNAALELKITNASIPIESNSIKQYLDSLNKENKLIVLIFDQFEELYSRPELQPIFDKAKDLMMSVSGLGGNICLGFAWKSDSTIPSDHPAYYFWHQLSDHRITRKLEPFSSGESNSALTVFEKELGDKLHNDLRHNLVASSQGYPWLLKKLCIHIYENIKNGKKQNDLLENKLDVSKLFDDDLMSLNVTEKECIRRIAERAPADWYEINETYGVDIMKSLIDKRLVIRSGNKLNIYWDIFKEYILTNNVPTIPLHYLPKTDFNSVNSIANQLEHNHAITPQEVMHSTEFSKGTVQNIFSDMYVFGVINKTNQGYILDNDVKLPIDESILFKYREKFNKHIFKLKLEDASFNSMTLLTLVDVLKSTFPNSEFSEKTWRTYTLRLCKWLELTGFLMPEMNGWSYRDLGNVDTSKKHRSSHSNKKIFTGPSSPKATVNALDWLIHEQRVTKQDIYSKHYRNCFVVLNRFGLCLKEGDEYVIDDTYFSDYNDSVKAIWSLANQEPILKQAVRVLTINARISGFELADILNEEYDLKWTQSSKIRNGNGIKQWSSWLLEGNQSGHIPPPPGR